MCSRPIYFCCCSSWTLLIRNGHLITPHHSTINRRSKHPFQFCSILGKHSSWISSTADLNPIIQYEILLNTQQKRGNIVLSWREKREWGKWQKISILNDSFKDTFFGCVKLKKFCTKWLTKQNEKLSFSSKKLLFVCANFIAIPLYFITICRVFPINCFTLPPLILASNSPAACHSAPDNNNNSWMHVQFCVNFIVWWENNCQTNAKQMPYYTTFFPDLFACHLHHFCPFFIFPNEISGGCPFCFHIVFSKKCSRSKIHKTNHPFLITYCTHFYCFFCCEVAEDFVNTRANFERISSKYDKKLCYKTNRRFASEYYSYCCCGFLLCNIE